MSIRKEFYIDFDEEDPPSIGKPVRKHDVDIALSRADSEIVALQRQRLAMEKKAVEEKVAELRRKIAAKQAAGIGSGAPGAGNTAQPSLDPQIVDLTAQTIPRTTSTESAPAALSSDLMPPPHPKPQAPKRKDSQPSLQNTTQCSDKEKTPPQQPNGAVIATAPAAVPAERHTAGTTQQMLPQLFPQPQPASTGTTTTKPANPPKRQKLANHGGNSSGGAQAASQETQQKKSSATINNKNAAERKQSPAGDPASPLPQPVPSGGDARLNRDPRVAKDVPESANGSALATASGRVMREPSAALVAIQEDKKRALVRRDVLMNLLAEAQATFDALCAEERALLAISSPPEAIAPVDPASAKPAKPALPESQRAKHVGEERQAQLAAFATAATQKIAARVKGGSALGSSNPALTSAGAGPSSRAPLLALTASTPAAAPLGTIGPPPPAQQQQQQQQQQQPPAALSPFEEFMRSLQAMPDNSFAQRNVAGARPSSREEESGGLSGRAAGGLVPAQVPATAALLLEGLPQQQQQQPQGPEEREEGELSPLDVEVLKIVPAKQPPSRGRSPLRRRSRSRSRSRELSRSRSRDMRRRRSRSRSRSLTRRSRSRSRSTSRRRKPSRSRSRSRSKSPVAGRNKPHSPAQAQTPRKDSKDTKDAGPGNLGATVTTTGTASAEKAARKASSPEPRPARTLSLRELQMPAEMEDAFLTALRRVAARRPGAPVASTILQKEIGPLAGPEALQKWGGTFSQWCLLLQKKGLVKLEMENRAWAISEVIVEQKQRPGSAGTAIGGGKASVTAIAAAVGGEASKGAGAKKRKDIAAAVSAVHVAASSPASAGEKKAEQAQTNVAKELSAAAAAAPTTAQPAPLTNHSLKPAAGTSAQKQQPPPPPGHPPQQTPVALRPLAFHESIGTSAARAVLPIDPSISHPSPRTPVVPIPSDPNRASVEGYIPRYEAVSDKNLLPLSLQAMAAHGVTARANRHFSSLLLAPGGVFRPRFDIAASLGLEFNLGGWYLMGRGKYGEGTRRGVPLPALPAEQLAAAAAANPKEPFVIISHALAAAQAADTAVRQGAKAPKGAQPADEQAVDRMARDAAIEAALKVLKVGLEAEHTSQLLWPLYLQLYLDRPQAGAAEARAMIDAAAKYAPGYHTWLAAAAKAPTALSAAVVLHRGADTLAHAATSGKAQMVGAILDLTLRALSAVCSQTPAIEDRLGEWQLGWTSESSKSGNGSKSQLKLTREVKGKIVKEVQRHPIMLAMLWSSIAFAAAYGRLPKPVEHRLGHQQQAVSLRWRRPISSVRLTNAAIALERGLEGLNITKTVFKKYMGFFCQPGWAPKDTDQQSLGIAAYLDTVRRFISATGRQLKLAGGADTTGLSLARPANLLFGGGDVGLLVSQARSVPDSESSDDEDIFTKGPQSMPDVPAGTTTLGPLATTGVKRKRKEVAARSGSDMDMSESEDEAGKAGGSGTGGGIIGSGGAVGSNPGGPGGALISKRSKKGEQGLTDEAATAAVEGTPPTKVTPGKASPKEKGSETPLDGSDATSLLEIAKNLVKEAVRPPPIPKGTPLAHPALAPASFKMSTIVPVSPSVLSPKGKDGTATGTATGKDGAGGSAGGGGFTVGLQLPVGLANDGRLGNSIKVAALLRTIKLLPSEDLLPIYELTMTHLKGTPMGAEVCVALARRAVRLAAARAAQSLNLSNPTVAEVAKTGALCRDPCVSWALAGAAGMLTVAEPRAAPAVWLEAIRLTALVSATASWELLGAAMVAHPVNVALEREGGKAATEASIVAGLPVATRGG